LAPNEVNYGARIVSVARPAWLPLALLLAYGVTFAWRALGVGPLAFDDHPGQLARLWHVLREGPAPWAWNDGWWAGYPELQFYPPGWFYLGGALSWLTLGALPPPVIYQALVWITYLAPGVTAFLLLRRLLRNDWPALPGAFLVLAFTGDPAGGAASGVEGGVRIGMVGARLAWALLPLLALTLARWTETGGPFPRAAILLIAAVILTHPTHAPAALAILAAAVMATAAPRRALAPAALAALVALGLVAFWLLPLLRHLAETRALAWGRLTAPSLATPFTAVLIGLALVATSRRRPACRALLHAVWLSATAVALDALVVEPVGARFMPADRVADGAWMTLLLASGLGAGVIVHAVGRRLPMAAAALAVTAALIAFSVPGTALTLWPRAAEWPSLPSVTRGLRLDDLWRTLRAAPPGRVLFVRSGVPLVYGSAWYRPHTHVTALTPVLAGREILGGTFTHGSPIAALVYRGDTRREPITRLAEQLDGASLFGQALETLDAATFERYAGRFHIAAVVALEDDAEHLPFLTDNPRYRRAIVPPFLVFITRIDPPRPTRRIADGSRELRDRGEVGEWISTGVAYYPLWRAERAGRPLATRRGRDGDLEIRAEAGPGGVRLVYGPGVAELVALLTSAVVVAALAADAWRRRARSALRDVPAGEDTERRADRV
jgi:hypothetical protein